MRRASGAVVLLLATLLHHKIHGPTFDYAGLAAAAAASWVGLPGPGEPVLLAAGILAAKNDLSLVPVLLVAWVAATAGGIIGWLIGLKAGRRVLTGSGPLRSLRLHTLERGEAIFARHPVIAIVMTPSFMAGIHRVRGAVYQPINAVAAAVWTVVIGVGGYLVGPPVLDVLDDVGTGFTIIILAVGVAIVALEVTRRRRRANAGTP